MRRRLFILALPAIVVALYLAIPGSVPRTSGPIPSDAYIWQQSWSPAVSAATTRPTAIQSFCILAAELTWRDGGWSVKRIDYDAASLLASAKPIGLAIRVTSLPRDSADTFDPASPATLGLRDACIATLKNATDVGLSPVELQLDVDCPESKLDGYREWVRVVQTAIRPTPVVITALPSWLDRPAFARLVAQSGPYVLQVHGIERPQHASALPVVCDIATANRAIERAAKIGVPFRLALPTYSYAAAFAPDGTFQTLWAEGPAPALAPDAQVRILSANCDDLTKLTADLRRSRPAAMTGIIWFRLPVESDRLNWSAETLDAVLAGKSPAPALAVLANGKDATANRVKAITLPSQVTRVDERGPAGASASEGSGASLVDLRLINAGNADAVDWRIRIRWKDSRLIASDTMAGIKVLASGDREITLAAADAYSARLAPAEDRPIGWLRFDRDTEVACEILPTTQP